ncbi:MAG: hypothetical protein LBL35_00420 [Clostridiales bacterium]|nr:hypothetical protein [Clostridiales bacterium]
MENGRYVRRRTAPRAKAREKSSYIETVTAQLVVCSITLAVALLINILDIPVAEQAKETIASTINNDDGLYAFAKIASSIKEFKKPAQSALGDLAEKDIYGPDSEAEEDSPPFADETSDRIDEDVLSELNSRMDYDSDLAKKRTVPLREE